MSIATCLQPANRTSSLDVDMEWREARDTSGVGQASSGFFHLAHAIVAKQLHQQIQNLASSVADQLHVTCWRDCLYTTALGQIKY